MEQRSASHRIPKKGVKLTRSEATAFILPLTITRVSSSSLNIFASNDLRTSGLRNIMPLGETGGKRECQCGFSHRATRGTHC